MKQITADKNLIAYCGLYCGACKKYLKEKCPACQKNEKASWCKIRICCIENNYLSCADCQKMETIADCKYFNNFLDKLISFFFRSDRQACINLIAEQGYEEYAKEMAAKELIAIKR